MKKLKIGDKINISKSATTVVDAANSSNVAAKHGYELACEMCMMSSRNMWDAVSQVVSSEITEKYDLLWDNKAKCLRVSKVK